jgi:hypothetical protein
METCDCYDPKFATLISSAIREKAPGPKIEGFSVLKKDARCRVTNI